MKKAILLLTSQLLVSLSLAAGNPVRENPEYAYIIDMEPTIAESVIGDLDDLRGQSSVFCFYYTDKATYEKAPITEVRDEFYDDRREETEAELTQKFIEEATDKGPDEFYFSSKKLSRYILKLHVTQVDDDGETDLYAMLFDTESRTMVFQKRYRSNGGTFGSLVNLMGDSAEKTGKKIGFDFAKMLSTRRK